MLFLSLLYKKTSTLLLVGSRKEECGGSIYYSILGHVGNSLPSADIQKLIKAGKVINKLAKEQLILACHDISEGGLAVSLSEMAFANNLGFSLLPNNSIDDDFYLFSETPGFVLEVDSANKEKIITEFTSSGVDCTEIGKTTDQGVFTFKECVIELKEAKTMFLNGLKNKLI